MTRSTGLPREPAATARGSELVVPLGALVVLIGPAGSGKSTFAAAHFPAGSILSSDAFRAQIGTGEADQSVSGAAFTALHRALERRLAAGQTTVVDATSLTVAARRALLDRARRAGATAIALVLDVPPDLVRERNAARAARVVPGPALTRQLDLLGFVSDARLRAEGFATVRRFQSPEEIAALRVVLGQPSS